MSIANPYRNIATRSEWGIIRVDGNTRFPGIVVSVSGLSRPIEWMTQYAIGTSGVGKIFKARKVVENAKIQCFITKAEFDAAQRFFDTVVMTPKGVRGKSHKIDNPAFASIRFTQFVFNAEPAIVPDGKGSWVVEYDISEYEKFTVAPMGAADPAKIDDPPKPKDELERRLEASQQRLNNALDGK